MAGNHNKLKKCMQKHDHVAVIFTFKETKNRTVTLTKNKYFIAKV